VPCVFVSFWPHDHMTTAKPQPDDACMQMSRNRNTHAIIFALGRKIKTLVLFHFW